MLFSCSSVKELQKWFKGHVSDDGKPYLLDPHQAAIVLDTHKNCLVTARAGSGKTRTVVAKIIYLIAHEKVDPAEIIVFAFNRKARAEINTRLSEIQIDGKPLVGNSPDIATTFHAFAFHLVDDGTLRTRLISEEFSNRLIETILRCIFTEKQEQVELDQSKNFIVKGIQFITRSEQLYFEDYDKLREQIDNSDNSKLKLYYQLLSAFHNYLSLHQLLNFNQLLVLAIKKLSNQHISYRYIFIDEYQDFSLLFLKLIQALRQTCPAARVLAVGDDWQAINGFAGSDLRFFQYFEQYFPEDYVKLFIPTNYRSGRKIVRSANYFMANSLGDYKDCKAGNKLKSHVHLVNLRQLNLPPQSYASGATYAAEQSFYVIKRILKLHPDNTIKFLSRNNDLRGMGWSLEQFAEQLLKRIKPEESNRLSFSTIHRSKGLEADVVVLLEINAGEFPKLPTTEELFSVFGETSESHLNEERRLFYVALTRAKQDLYILTNTPPKFGKRKSSRLNFLEFMNPNWLEDFRC